MASGMVVDILQVMHGFGSSLSSKLGPFLTLLTQFKNATSIGAIAGFAIALFCMWRYLKASAARRIHGSKRSAQRQQQNQRRGEAGGSTAAANSAGASATGASMSITKASQRGARDALQQPVQMTLAKMVQHQLNGAKRMTCQMLGVILEEQCSEELEFQATVRRTVVEVVQEIARQCDLYLLVRVESDASELAVMSALDDAGLFSSGSVNRDKVLFCGTDAGKASFVRQLEPEWHVDTSAEAISTLSKFVRHELHIVKDIRDAVAAPNVVGCETFERYFGLPASTPHASEGSAAVHEA
eukprot:TRINITY_DN19274_c0_g1_i1.p1 TRINITY_DN19274_c0_g1~~TRINITY_DN19274_c0_g1_i1.p1  ORF type:complete len:299 (-),score=43.27 TRINITY_DN19274_c0_g1_i1:589-1485(-)